MAILYLTEQQAWVGREGDCLIVHIPERNEDGSNKGKQERKMTVPLFKVEEVMVLGDITLSTPALASLLGAKIQVTYLTKYGKYLGSLNPQLTKNSILRLAQHAAHIDAAKRHAVAQQFVSGKLRNMRTILMRYQRTQNDPLISKQLETLKQCIRAAAETKLDVQNNTIEWHEIDDIAEVEQEVSGETVPDRMNGLGSLLGCEGAG